MPTIRWVCIICLVTLGPRALGRGDVYHFMFSLVLHISCQQLGGFILFVWCLWALRALGRGYVYHFMFSLVLYISCQQLGGFVLFVW